MNQNRIELVTALLTRIGKLEFDAVGEQLDENAVMSLPYLDALEDIRGKDAIIAQMKATIPAMLQSMHITVDAWYLTTDPDVVIAEYHSKCPLRSGKGFYENQYVGIFRFKDDKVLLYKEYMNPLKLDVYQQQ